MRHTRTTLSGPGEGRNVMDELLIVDEDKDQVAPSVGQPVGVDERAVWERFVTQVRSRAHFVVSSQLKTEFRTLAARYPIWIASPFANLSGLVGNRSGNLRLLLLRRSTSSTWRFLETVFRRVV